MVRTSSFLSGTLALLASVALAKEINMMNVASSEEYTSGAVHGKLMGYKMVSSCLVELGSRYSI